MTDHSFLKSLANNYRESIADSKNPDMFSLGYQWADKPHRHVYDLCKKLEEAADTLKALEAENKELRSEVVTFLALWANDHAQMQGLNGLHPGHYDRLKELGARMDRFKRAALGESDGNN